MKKLHYIIPTLFLLLATASCEKMIEFDIDEVNPMVVVASQNEVDSTAYVRLTYSRFFLDHHDFRVIDNANIQLYVNGTAFNGSPTFDGNRYLLGYKPQPGDTMSISIDVPGYETVTAGTRVPQRPTISNPQVQVQPSDDNYYPYVEVRIDLTDDGETENYYSVTVYEEARWHYIQYTTDMAGDTIADTTNNGWSYQPIWCEMNDVVINPNTDVTAVLDDDSDTRDIFFFTDENINGRTHSIPLRFRVYGTNRTDTTVTSSAYYINHEEHSYYLQVVSYNRDTYRYLRTAQAASDENNDLSIFSEPTQVYSNINNGIGIFGAKSSKVIKLDIPDIEMPSWYYKQKQNNKK